MQHPIRVEVLFTRTTFEEIVNDYDDLEKQVWAATLRTFADTLTGSEYASGEVEVRGQAYFLEHDVSGAAATLTIRMRPVELSKSAPVLLEEKINEVGIVKRVVIRCDQKSATAAERALGAAMTVLASSYRSLERRFLDQYRDFHKGLFIGIEPILFACFDQYHMPHLAQECLLSITPLKTSKFSFYLCPEQVRRILLELKQLNIDEGSLELLITLLVEEASDSFIARNILRTDEFTTLAFSELWNMNGNPRLVRAESVVTKGRKISALELCRVKGFSLQANLPARFAKHAEDPIHSVRRELTEQFAHNIDLAGWTRGKLGLSWSARQTRKKVNLNTVLNFVQGTIAQVVIQGKPPGMP
jgi:hypothetical protein